MKLSNGEKLIILMLADMYKVMKLKGEFDPEFISETTHSDHLWGFNWRFTGIPPFEKEASPVEVGQTCDYLDMWHFIERGYDQLTPADKKKVNDAIDPISDPKFLGFDGNNEDHYYMANFSSTI